MTLASGCSALESEEDKNNASNEMAQNPVYNTVTSAEYRTSEEKLENIRIEGVSLEYDERDSVPVMETSGENSNHANWDDFESLTYGIIDENGHRVDEGFIPLEELDDDDGIFEDAVAIEGSMTNVVEAYGGPHGTDATYDTQFRIDNVDQ